MTGPPYGAVAARAGAELATYVRWPLTLVRGEGSTVWDDAGRPYLDLYGGHAVASTGHSHPEVARAIAEQARKLLFYSNVVALPVRERAAEAIVRQAPPPLARVLFVNSGTEANENAMRLARRTTRRSGIVSAHGGFHGRTADAISAAGLEKYRALGAPNVPGHRFVPFGDLEALDAALDEIDRQGDASARAHELAYELSDDPETEHGDRITEADLGDADRVERDAPEGREARFLERHGVRNRNDEVSPGDDSFGVPGALAPVCDPRPDVHIRHGRMLVDEDSGSRVAERRVFIELRENLVRRPHGIGDLHYFPDLSEMGGILGDFPDDRFLMDARRFGPARDEGKYGSDENVMGLRDRLGDFVHDNVPEPFSNNLFHRNRSFQRMDSVSDLFRRFRVRRENLNATLSEPIGLSKKNTRHRASGAHASSLKHQGGGTHCGETG